MSATEMTAGSAKTPWHLWVVGVVALLFNAIGVYDFVMSHTQGAAYLTQMGMSPAQIEHYLGMPVWMTVVWAVGVFGAFLASVLLLLRKKLAFPVFVVSLAAFLLSLVYHYVLTDGRESLGGSMVIADVVITALLLFFIWYSRLMSTRGVLR